jgi:hypothetical protein
LPPGSGEIAKLYGDIDRPGPYLVLMKWKFGIGPVDIRLADPHLPAWRQV